MHKHTKALELKSQIDLLMLASHRKSAVMRVLGRHWKAVYSREARVYTSARASPKASKEAPMQHSFYRPQVCRLPNEGGTVDLLQTRKEVFVMPLEIGEYRRIGVFLKRGLGTKGVLLLPKLLFEVGGHLIGETKHLDNESIEALGWRERLISGVQCSQPEIRASPVYFLTSRTRTSGSLAARI
jgi:hypothetical protein